MGLEQALGNFFFRSRFSNWLWNTSTGSPFYLVRLVGAVFISAILLVRSYRLFLYTKLTGAPVLGFVVVGTIWTGPIETLQAGALVVLAYLTWTLARQPQVNFGHRAGGKGFNGPLVENSLEALKNLIRRDADPHPLRDLHYVEFDIHESKDGELMVLHDLGSVLAASQDAPVNHGILQDIKAQGLDISRAKVQDLTAEQLKAIHLGGQQGMHIPTLEEFLKCCKKEGLRRSVAVEVKLIVTDDARQKFLDSLRNYKQTYCQKLEESCPDRQYKPFGWVAAIAFPFAWAPSFGEFCFEMWQNWAFKFREARIPVRSCVLHSLDLVPAMR